MKLYEMADEIRKSPAPSLSEDGFLGYTRKFFKIKFVRTALFFRIYYLRIANSLFYIFHPDITPEMVQDDANKKS